MILDNGIRDNSGCGFFELGAPWYISTVKYQLINPCPLCCIGNYQSKIIGYIDTGQVSSCVKSKCVNWLFSIYLGSATIHLMSKASKIAEKLYQDKGNQPGSDSANKDNNPSGSDNGPIDTDIS